jgi:two-component system, NarL family, response regulator
MPTNRKVVPWRSRSGRRALPSQSDLTAEEARIKSMLHPNGQLPRPENTNLSSPKPSLDPATECLPHSEIKPTRTIAVLVADDHPVVREGLVGLIDRQPDMHVVAEAGNGREAMEKFLAERPDVALLDLRMPIMDGIETVMSICERDPAAHLGIITSCQNEEDIYRAVRAGALGFILKDAAPDELARCIKAMARGKTWVPPLVGAMLAKRVADKELTRRETEVLNVVVAGKSNKEIGVALDISEATVKVHMTHILEKLKVTGRTEAINVAVKRGLVRVDMATVA